MNHPEHNRNNGSPLVVSEYTEAELAEANRKHDESMGWYAGLGNIYTNPRRLSESYFGKLEAIWDRTKE